MKLLFNFNFDSDLAEQGVHLAGQVKQKLPRELVHALVGTLLELETNESGNDDLVDAVAYYQHTPGRLAAVDECSPAK